MNGWLYSPIGFIAVFTAVALLLSLVEHVVLRWRRRRHARSLYAHLTAEEIEAYVKSQVRSNLRIDTPEGVDALCAYCGKVTKQKAITDLDTNTSWPPCCSNVDCLDQWEPLKK